MILEKIKNYFEAKKYITIERSVGEGLTKLNRGYIINYNINFLLLQEANNFKLEGYLLLPINQIKKIRNNRNDKYYHKIMTWQGETEKIGIHYLINIDSWQTAFADIKAREINVIIECETPSIDTFNIGPIVKTTKNKVYIQYFDAAGYIDEKPTPIDLKKISRVNFDDNYINVFSKYLRKHKNKN